MESPWDGHPMQEACGNILAYATNPCWSCLDLIRETLHNNFTWLSLTFQGIIMSAHSIRLQKWWLYQRKLHLSDVTSQLGKSLVLMSNLNSFRLSSFLCLLTVFACVYHVGSTKILYALRNREKLQSEKILIRWDLNPIP